MRIALWIVQLLLAALFLAAGLMKGLTPLTELSAQMPWVSDAPAFLPRLIGVSEVLAAIGLVLPSALRIAPKLTPAAALGLVTVMVLAMPMHIAYGELASLPVNLVLAGLAALVAWGRLGPAPIAPRTWDSHSAAAPAK